MALATNYSQLGPTPGMINTQNKSAFSGLALSPTGGSIKTLSPQVSQVKSIAPTTPQTSSPYSGLGLNVQGQATINGKAQQGSTMVNGKPIGTQSILSPNFGLGASNLQTGFGLIPSSQAATSSPTAPAGTELVNQQGQKTGVSSPMTPIKTGGSSGSGGASGIVNPALYYGNASGTPTFDANGKPINQNAGGNTGGGDTGSGAGNTGTGIVGIGGKYYKNGIEVDANGNALSSTNTSTNTNTQNTQYNTTNPATFPGLINQLSNTASQPTQSYTDLQKQIAANLEAQKQLQTNYAEQYKNLDTSGINASLATGQENVMARTLAAKEGYLAQQGQGLSTQLGAANTQQGLQQTGLTSAAGLTQPQLGQYGQAYYQPMNAGQGGQGGVSQSDPFYKTLQNYAQQAANGQYSSIPSSITSNSVLNDQMNQMAKQINPAYNPVTSAAQSGITAQQAGNVAAMTAAYQSASNLGSQLQDLIKTFTTNPSDINAVNAGIQKVAANTSDPHYKALSNLVTDLVATYASILTPGASTDTSRATAASLLDASAKGTSIIETLKNLDEQAKAKIAGQTTNYGANPGTGSTGGGSVSAGGYSFVQNAQGQWVVKT